MISDKLEISIIIPSKNDEKIFLKNVESIKKYFQDKEWNYELILVSNGSTQENIDEIIKLENKEPTINNIKPKPTETKDFLIITNVQI